AFHAGHDSYERSADFIALPAGDDDEGLDRVPGCCSAFLAVGDGHSFTPCPGCLFHRSVVVAPRIAVSGAPFSFQASKALRAALRAAAAWTDRFRPASFCSSSVISLRIVAARSGVMVPSARTFAISINVSPTSP